MMNYYSTDYTNTDETGLAADLNQSIATAAVEEGAVVADVFTAFENVAATAGGLTCNAGLLNASSAN